MIVTFWFAYSVVVTDFIPSVTNFFQVMGACVCVQKNENDMTDSSRRGHHQQPGTSHSDSRTQGQRSHSAGHSRQSSARSSSGRRSSARQYKNVDSLVLETLLLIRTLVDNEQGPPQAMLILHKIAESEEGWFDVVKSLILSIPMTDPLGPAVITLLLDECPLPTKEAVLLLCQRLKIAPHGPAKEFSSVCCQRNIGVVLGCLAEKLAGPNSVAVLTDNVLNYLLGNLTVGCPCLSDETVKTEAPCHSRCQYLKEPPCSTTKSAEYSQYHQHMNKKFHPAVILHSLVALEKFAQTSENKLTITKCVLSKEPHCLEVLENEWWRDENYFHREVGFCARWCLDNLFVKEDREFSYEKEDLQNINVMLNSNDVSEYLKIAADGLEARCDASSFESVRCTFQVDSGVWYYEVTIETDGVMQIGWATKASSFLNHEGYGIGDDEYSMSYDGCRQLIWFKSESRQHTHRCWQSGDILGLLLNVEKEELVFSLNGDSLPPFNDLFKNARGGFFAAASFMSYQQCYFNFGAKPYKYPPKGVDFCSFNDHGSLSDEEKIILPRHKKLDLLNNIKVHENSCTLCYDRIASYCLLPCNHSGFCFNCVIQVEICPICRTKIEERVIHNNDDENSTKTVTKNTSPSEIFVVENVQSSVKEMDNFQSSRKQMDNVQSSMRQMDTVQTSIKHMDDVQSSSKQNKLSNGQMKEEKATEVS